MSKLFSPKALGPLRLENALVVSPMCQYKAKDGLPGAWHLAHLGAMALSGAGLVILEATGITPNGRISPACLGIYTDEQQEALARLVTYMRELRDLSIGIQLSHAGRKSSVQPFDGGGYVTPAEGGWELIGPSAVVYRETAPAARALSEAEISEYVGHFGDAAARARAAGFDMVEIHAAHGYLLSSFLSPLANKREDGYGGDLAGRARFLLEVADAVRARVGDMPVGVRLSATDHMGDEGITLAETAIVAGWLKERGVAYVACSSGGNSLDQKLPQVEAAYQAPYAEFVRRQSGIETIAVGMFNNAQDAENALQRGQCDFVAVGRNALDSPRFGLHWQNALDNDAIYPKSYWRIAPDFWRGYRPNHPEYSHERRAALSRDSGLNEANARLT
ncbi:MAG: oxidoreductase [Pseudaminobacter sp.]